MSERDTIQFNYSVYHYNNFMKEIISKWKYRGDSSLGYIFGHVFAATFRKLRSTLPQDIVAVPIPLNEQRQLERGFNQAAMLAGFLPIQTMEILERSTSEKQSKKTRNERIQSVNPFIVEKAINKPVILVDDIYTTGTTLRHAGKVLLEQGCPFVCALTLIRG
ncbi:ComF family protein [Virgibacillus proomii]|uniref:ComF family protein n=1 Tax=Virgibacillus proomii TaxID=84407 RepID=UPI0020A049A6|nr:ComF family protein [Virgibacillus proomii]